MVSSHFFHSLMDFRKDLYVIFNRPANHLAPLDGFRVLLNFSVVALHVYQFLTYFMPREGDIYSNWSFHPLGNVYMYWSLQVDGFLVLSGFLLMRHILTSVDRTGEFSPFHIIVNKFFRLAPSMYALLIVCILLGDPNLEYFPAAFAFIRNYLVDDCDNWPNSIGHVWSNGIELQLCVAVSILCFVLHKTGLLNMKVLIGLFGLSWLIGYLYWDPELANIGKLLGKPHYSYLTAKESVKWFKNEFNHTLPTNLTCNDDPAYIGYVEYFYLPSESRYAGYIVGCMLAYQLHQMNQSWKTQQHKTSTFWNIVGWILFSISSLFLLLLAAPPKNEHSPIEAEMFVTLSVRQLFSMALAFIMYCTLVPEDHPFYAKRVAKFFGMWIWFPLATLSYGVYMVHYRFMWEVGFRWLKPRPEEITAAFHLKFWLILMAISQVTALVEYLVIQGPIMRWRHAESKKKQM